MSNLEPKADEIPPMFVNRGSTATFSRSSIFNPANLAEDIGHPLVEIFAARRAAYTISPVKRR